MKRRKRPPLHRLGPLAGGIVATVVVACSAGGGNNAAVGAPDALCRRAVPELTERTIVWAGVPLESCTTGRCFHATMRGYWRVNSAQASHDEVVLVRDGREVWPVRAFAVSGSRHAVRSDVDGIGAVFTDVGHLRLKPWDEPPFVLEFTDDQQPGERVVRAIPHSGGFALLIEGPCGPAAHDALWRRWRYVVEPEYPIRQIVRGDGLHRQVSATAGAYRIAAGGTEVRVPAAARPLDIEVRGDLVFVTDSAKQTITLYDLTGAIRTEPTAAVISGTTAHGMLRHDPRTSRVEHLGRDGDDALVLDWGNRTRLDGTVFGPGEKRVRMDVQSAPGGLYLVERVRGADCDLTDQLFRWFAESGELIALTSPSSNAIYHPQQLQTDDAWVSAERRIRFIAP